MEYHIVWYFTKVYIICNDKNNIQGIKKYIFFTETLTSNLLKYKQESSILRVPLEYKSVIK